MSEVVAIAVYNSPWKYYTIHMDGIYSFDEFIPTSHWSIPKVRFDSDTRTDAMKQPGNTLLIEARRSCVNRVAYVAWHVRQGGLVD